MMAANLPGSPRPTTALGFGCSALSGGSGRRQSIKLVHAAYDADIRHFDVAPPYGMGTAEDVLGEALKGRRHDTTVATKVGITRPRHGSAIILMRSLASPLRKLVPVLTRQVGASAYRGSTAHAKLDAGFVEASVTDSLRRLRTDYLDLLLLHEVSLGQLTSELLSLLGGLRQKGLIRALGTGTSYERTLAIRTEHRTFFDVWQYSWSVLDVDQQGPMEFTITHRAIQRALIPLRDWLHKYPARMRRLSDATGVDLSVGDNLGDVLLGAAMANNPGGITLVSSRQKGRIEANARLLSDENFVGVGQQLIAALAAEEDVVRL
jgi:aryl-alcohol dehydrogenase-like predicted oxidoreductase